MLTELLNFGDELYEIPSRALGTKHQVRLIDY